MDKHRLGVYLGEVVAQCQYAGAAAAEAQRMLVILRTPTGGPGDPARRNAHYELFRALHSLLTHASNVSKLLWPTTGGKGVAAEFRAERGAELRQALALSEDHHPLKGQTLRNHLEHFDERLDDWSLTSKHHNLAQDNIGPASTFGMDERDVMRGFDPETRRFTFRGESYDLNELVRALADMTPKAHAALQKTMATN